MHYLERLFIATALYGAIAIDPEGNHIELIQPAAR